MRQPHNNPESASPAQETTDRRLFERHRYGQIVQVVWMDGMHVQRQVQRYRTTDISRGGVRLLSKRMQYEGTLGIVLLTRSDGEHVRYGIRVRSAVYVGGLLYATGCEFVEPPERLLRATRIVDGQLDFSDRIEDQLI